VEGAKAEAPAMAAERIASFMLRYVLEFVKNISDKNYEHRMMWPQRDEYEWLATKEHLSD